MVKGVGKAERRGPGRARRWPRCGSRASATGGPASSPAASGSGSRWPAPWSTGPEVLLLDEPLGALDLKLREQMQVELKAIQREVGITFLFVTHDQEEALTMSDRIAVFNHGRIEQVGTPARGLRAPGDGVRRRLRRHVEPARRASRAARCSATTAPVRVRPEKIARSAPAGRGRARRGRRRRAWSPRSSTPVPSTRVVVRLDAGADLAALVQNTGDPRPTPVPARGEPGPARLRAGSTSTASRPTARQLKSRTPRVTTVCGARSAREGTHDRHQDWSRSARPRCSRSRPAAAAAATTRRQHVDGDRQRGGPAGLHPAGPQGARQAGRPRGRAQHRRLGRATPRTARPTRRSTG